MIDPDETAIVGEWIKVGDRVEGDGVCGRIEKLTNRYFEELGAGGTGWETLYRDPTDGRFWEHTYRQSEMHGGGPPALSLLSADAAREKYSHLFGEVE